MNGEVSCFGFQKEIVALLLGTKAEQQSPDLGEEDVSVFLGKIFSHFKRPLVPVNSSSSAFLFAFALSIEPFNVISKKIGVSVEQCLAEPRTPAFARPILLVRGDDDKTREFHVDDSHLDSFLLLFHKRMDRPSLGKVQKSSGEG